MHKRSLYNIPNMEFMKQEKRLRVLLQIATSAVPFNSGNECNSAIENFRRWNAPGIVLAGRENTGDLDNVYPTTNDPHGLHLCQS